MLDQRIIELSPDEQDYAHAVELAIELNHAYQDCLYLAAALRLKAPLVTADVPFYLKASAGYRTVQPLFPGMLKKKKP